MPITVYRQTALPVGRHSLDSGEEIGQLRRGRGLGKAQVDLLLFGGIPNNAESSANVIGMVGDKLGLAQLAVVQMIVFKVAVVKLVS